MEIMCCTSLRGAAFFGASVHIAVGLLLFSRYVVATFVFTFYNFNDLFSEKVTTFLAPFMVYVTLLLALGLLIFHSVEKECFFLLKWSSVAFSLLQLAVFLAILLLKFSPSYQYHQFPFLPPSLTSGHFPTATWSPNGGGYFPPSGPSILTVPHGAVLVEQPLSKSPSSDPPDPGGGPFGDLPWRPSLLREIQRLALLISSVLLTLVYLFFLFLYVRQLNYEDTGHVFGHAQAITRNIAFYVQPQFTAPTQPHHHHQPTQDNNKLSQVQQSQTQIPSQFLPQEGHSTGSLPKKSSLTKPLNPATTTATPGAPAPTGGALPSLSGSSLGGDQRSPKRIQRHGQQEGGPKVDFAMNMTDFNAQRSSATPHGGGARETHITSGVGGATHSGPSIGGVGSPTPQRSPIPAQVRINFYPKDLIREFQGDDPPSIGRGGDFLQESDHHRPHLPLQPPPPPSRAPPPPPHIPQLPPPPLPPRQQQPYQTTHHHPLPPTSLPPPHHHFQQGPHPLTSPEEIHPHLPPLPHHLHQQGPPPHHPPPHYHQPPHNLHHQGPHHYPQGHQSVQYPAPKQQLVHHNLYPSANLSDSVSPASSVAYSPNPRGLKGHHMVSMV